MDDATNDQGQDQSNGQDTDNMTGYCVSCREKDRDMKNVNVETSENGRRMAKGNCAVCDTKMTKFLPSADKAA